MKFYEDYDSFKLFAVDLGLFGAMSEVTARDVLVNDKAFTEYKGAFPEQYVIQKITGLNIDTYYYSKENSTLEIDFIVQKEYVYPIEVKAEENLRSKSLRAIHDTNDRLRPCRFSMADYREQEWMHNVPLYLVQEWINSID